MKAALITQVLELAAMQGAFAPTTQAMRGNRTASPPGPGNKTANRAKAKARRKAQQQSRRLK